MNKILIILVLGVIIALLKAALIALVVGLLLALTISFIRRPGHTIGFLGCLGLLGLAGAQPLACILMLGAVGVVVVALGTHRETAKLLLLTDGREGHPN